MCVKPLLSYEENGKVKNIKDVKWTTRDYYKKLISNKIVLIKCGKCKECLRDKRIELIQRIKKESTFHENNIFVTLTYDNENLKELNKKDIQKFLKRIRKDNKLRYVYFGELGEKTERAHYHIILFNYKPKDLEKIERKTKKGHIQYKSKYLTKKWGMGLVTISLLEDTLISYITKYFTKSIETNNRIYGWSRKPPLGIKDDENELKKEMKKTSNRKYIKNYYKNHYGEYQKTEEQKLIEIENKEYRIKKIEQLTKNSYFKYIEQKSSQ